MNIQGYLLCKRLKPSFRRARLLLDHSRPHLANIRHDRFPLRPVAFCEDTLNFRNHILSTTRNLDSPFSRSFRLTLPDLYPYQHPELLCIVGGLPGIIQIQAAHPS